MLGNKTMRIRELEEQVTGLRRDIADRESCICKLTDQIEDMKQKAAHPASDADVMQAMRDTIRDGLNKLEQPAPMFAHNLSVRDIFTLVMTYMMLCRESGAGNLAEGTFQ